jgi:hypothetical protein
MLMQAVVCPESSPMVVDAAEIIHSSTRWDHDNFEFDNKEEKDENQLSIKTVMIPNGDKYHTFDIKGLKIFLKMQLFILVQHYFMNAFPVYTENSKDKPNGFNADPERDNLMFMTLNLERSLICLLNQPG